MNETFNLALEYVICFEENKEKNEEGGSSSSYEYVQVEYDSSDSSFVYDMDN